MKGFKNARVYITGEGIKTLSVGFENGVIKYIGEDASVITEQLPIEKSQVLLPAFIDEHIHGAGGFDAMDGTVEALGEIAKSVAQEGTSCFLATTMTQSKENITKALNAVKEYREKNSKDGAYVYGVHLEGPFICKKFMGAQPEEYIATPDIEVFKAYQKASGNSIRIVSIAPEVEGALDLIKYMSENGVVASAGHTDCGYTGIEKAVEYGLTNITHTYNAQKPIHHRDIGTVGAAYSIDSLNCECICDTIHVSVPAIKLLIKNKPHDKFTLITDAMRAKNLGDCISELGGQKVIVKDGEARLENGTLAGSVLKMNDAIKNLVLKCGVKFTDAVDFASANPAKNLSLFNERGSIAVGKKADFTIMEEDFSIIATFRDGNYIYKI